jgi:hypothetical protein
MKNTICILFTLIGLTACCNKQPIPKQRQLVKVNLQTPQLQNFTNLTVNEKQQLVLSGPYGYAVLNSNLSIIDERLVTNSGFIHNKFNRNNNYVYPDYINGSDYRLSFEDIYSKDKTSFTLLDLAFTPDEINCLEFTSPKPIGLVDFKTQNSENIISFVCRDTTYLKKFQKDIQSKIIFVSTQKLYTPNNNLFTVGNKYYAVNGGYLCVYKSITNEPDLVVVYNQLGQITDSLKNVTKVTRNESTMFVITNSTTLHLLDANTFKFNKVKTFDNILDLQFYDNNTMLLLNKLELVKVDKSTYASSTFITTHNLFDGSNNWHALKFGPNILVYKLARTILSDGQLYYIKD